MREIKFRVWYIDQFWYFDISNRDDLTELKCWNLFEKEQYTGLKDKNGKEIYEGDILGFSNHKVFKIIEYNLMDGFNIPANIYGTGSPWAVIGNIHENPELLEQK